MAGEDAADGSGLSKGRHETETERLDRNWEELLQELRVTQTGVQLLSGFLLTLPFQQRFTQISSRDQSAYLLAFALAAISTILLVGPAMAHRLLFRRRAKGPLVAIANRYAKVGLATFALAVVVVVFLIFDVVVGLAAGIVAAGVTVVLFLTSWIAVPLNVMRHGGTSGDR